jgi:hypothetical protein
MSLGVRSVLVVLLTLKRKARKKEEERKGKKVNKNFVYCYAFDI